MDRKTVLRFYIVGTFFIVIAGMLLHFTFEWSGGNRFVALFSSVNESVWEHLKMGFWPVFVFSFVEFFSYGLRNKNYFIAKALSFYFIPIFIAAFFYGYTALLKRHILFLDILIFILSIILAQSVSFRVMIKKGRSSAKTRVFSFILILIIVAAFTILTYFPIEAGLFLDPVTKTYGIINAS